jgi:hypothetical protein
MKFKEDDCSEGMEPRTEGVYSGVVAEVEEKLTKNDDDMWSIKFEDEEDGQTLCYDNLVFSKSGKGIAFTKLKNLGVEKVDGCYECESQDLIGKTVQLNLVEETYNNKTHLTPDINADGFGYQLIESDDPGF